MHCFYCEKIGEMGGIAKLAKDEHRHCFKTLRGQADDKINLIDGKGIFATAQIMENKSLNIINIKKNISPSTKIHLFVSVPKKNKMDQLLRQCTEVGVWSINPIITERSVSKPEKNSILERWKSITIEACKQSNNPFFPIINKPITLNTAFKSVKGYSSFFGAIKIKNIKYKKMSSDIAWFIGPEGGFTLQEEELMLKHNIRPLNLGEYIMRVETAAVTGIAILKSFSAHEFYYETKLLPSIIL